MDSFPLVCKSIGKTRDHVFCYDHFTCTDNMIAWYGMELWMKSIRITTHNDQAY